MRAFFVRWKRMQERQWAETLRMVEERAARPIQPPSDAMRAFDGAMNVLGFLIILAIFVAFIKLLWSVL